MRQRPGSTEDGDHLIVKLAGAEIVLVPDAIPAAVICCTLRRRLVGQPFLRDQSCLKVLQRAQHGGPYTSFRFYITAIVPSPYIELASLSPRGQRRKAV